MKGLILALLLVATNAYADKWLEMPNEAGGKILLINSKCKNDGSGKLVLATTPGGGNVGGCWYYFANMIHVVWENGKTSSFEPNDFTPRESK